MTTEASSTPPSAMATEASSTPPSAAPSSSAVVSFLKSYSFPLILLSLSIVFQLFVIPAAFPPSHYDALGVRRFASIEEVNEAYDKLSSKWISGTEVPKTVDFIEVRYAFELLSNPVWKRDYDTYGVDEHLHVLERLKGQYDSESFSKIEVPLLNASSFDPTDHAFNVITTQDFMSSVGNDVAQLIQVYSYGSNQCAQFSSSWRRVASLLDGVAGVSMVELGDVQLASYLAERRSTGQPFFRNGLPSIVAIPPGCRSSDCLVRYQGDLQVDSIVDWFATDMLGLPRILYYSKESLQKNFITKSGQHKVKVICFSNTGERAAPFLRQAARDYWAYASFAFVLWRQEEASIWWNTLEVESAPAVVFLKDPTVKPVVHHGYFNSSSFLNLMKQNKHQELPQLRSITSMELGCDARGYSRAGNDTLTWYCVILAGRPSLELNQMRETMRRVQDTLLIDKESDTADKDHSVAQLAANALNEKRLTFAWLDGEAQQKYCFFYLFSETSYETCGPRRYGDPTDVPGLFIVRYKRNLTRDDAKVKKYPKTIWDSFQEDDDDLASQLVARFNGSTGIQEIIQWISQIIKDGDSRDLPFFTTKTPELIPEDADPVWLKGAQGILSSSKGLKQNVQRILSNIYDRMKDPRLGPFFLLGACISYGSIWLKRSQATKPTTEVKDEADRARRRRNRARSSNHDQPSSVTDVEPKDAFQMLLPSDSDSE